jgi:hypothetical protein
VCFAPPHISDQPSVSKLALASYHHCGRRQPASRRWRDRVCSRLARYRSSGVRLAVRCAPELQIDHGMVTEFRIDACGRRRRTFVTGCYHLDGLDSKVGAEHALGARGRGFCGRPDAGDIALRGEPLFCRQLPKETAPADRADPCVLCRVGKLLPPCGCNSVVDHRARLYVDRPGRRAACE